MSIPSDPSGPPSVNPHPLTPGSQQPTPPPGGKPSVNLDPTGVWTKFLSAGGMPATPEEVNTFVKGILKTFNLLIQQQQKAAARAHEQMKKAIQGEE